MDTAIVSAVLKAGGGAMKFGTQRTRAILDKLGSPDGKLKIIHIAGTNGKGSVAQYVTAILLAAGKRTGTFTSPAVFGFYEQIAVDGAPLEKERADGYLKAALEAAEDGATPFEILTAAAFAAFAGEGCEYAVAECGLGGLSDATNAVLKKEMALITSIGLDHTAVLGGTIGEISRQKAGIIRDCPAVVCALQPPEALDFFRARKCLICDKITPLSADGSGQRFLYCGREFFTRMQGFAQPYNAAVAIECARGLGIGEEAIRKGIAEAFSAGRLQTVRSGKNTYILDGGHNPAGVEPLAAYLKEFFPGGATLVFGCLADKDADGVLSRLAPCARKIYVVTPDSPRAADRSVIAEICRKYCGDVVEADGVSRALESAEGTVAVCGTFTILKEASDWIGKRS